MKAFNVFLYGKWIDTVFYTLGFTANDVRSSLINHDGYNSEIVVQLRA